MCCLLAADVAAVSASEDLFVPKDDNFRAWNRIRDITDGKQYRKQHTDKRLQLGKTFDTDVLITIILNTDGLDIYSNPSESAWPVFGTVAEIDPTRRFLSDKILNIALWSGDGKPPVDCIFRYLQEDLNELNQGTVNFVNVFGILYNSW